MEEAKTLIRTTVRTFFTHPKQILIVDAILLHSVLQMDDLTILTNAQPKDIRSLLNPLRAARLVQNQSRIEVRVGSQRGSPREYYYCPFHPAIDAIKYRIAKLRKKVEALYQQDNSKRKDWRCPRCKAEYEELEILDKVGEEGFYCDRCGTTLVQIVQATQDRGNHEKIRRLNDQLKKFDDMILKIDRKDVPENDFASAWERKKEVPRPHGTKSDSQYVAVSRANKNEKRGPDFVKAENLELSLTSGAEQDREEARRKEERRRQLAKQNQMPVWHSNSAISATAAGGVKTEATDTANGLLPKKEEGDDEQKPDLAAIGTNTLQDEVAAYMAEMEREREEAEERAKEEDAEEDEEDMDDFEDVDVDGTGTGSNVGTPASSPATIPPSSNQSHPPSGLREVRSANGVKRDFDEESGPSSDANTPMSSAAGDGRESKRVKFEDGASQASFNARDGSLRVEAGSGPAADSDEDEDFEDAM